MSFATAGACTVAGTTVTIAGAGTCTVTASQGGNADYSAAPNVAQSFAIAKAAATILLDGLGQTYDGTPKAATVTTTPSGLLGVTVTYGGSTAPPTNAGSYAVLAVLAHPDYLTPDATGTLVIAKASQTIAFDPVTDRNIGDPPFTANATASSGLPVSFSAWGGCSLAGSTVTLTVFGVCALTATQGGNGNYLAAPNVVRSFGVLGSALSDNWTPASSPGTPRRDGTATLLLDGRVLVTGGLAGLYTNTAELYDASTDTWSSARSLNTERYLHTATLLSDGRVLVVGGLRQSGQIMNTAELYDASANTWNPAGNLATARYGHTATLLPDGRVLVAGGGTPSLFTTTAELHDANEHVEPGGSLAQSSCRSHTATLLPDGRVLVAEGSTGSGYTNSAELYDVSMNAWASAGNLTTGRAYHTATLLLNGRVLIVGGSQGPTPMNTVETFDVSTNAWSPAGSLATARYSHTATLLPDGRTLVAGGNAEAPFTDTAELYDAGTNTWNAAAHLATGRSDHTATLLLNGRVLVSGGAPSAEIYGKTLQTITFAALLDRTLGDPTFSVNATASSGLATTFGAAGPCSVAGNLVTLTGAGNCTITAVQSGSAEFTPAPSVARAFAILAPLTVSKAGAGAGTVTSAPSGVNCGADCNEAYAAGTVVTLTAASAAGSLFGGWGGACSGTAGCSVTMTGARSVTATFVPNDQDLLVIAVVGTPPAVALPGASFSLTDTTRNQGGLAAPNSRTNYVLSLDATRDDTDVVVGGRGAGALAAGVSSSGPSTVTIPGATGLGTYRLLVCADDLKAIPEADENNNCLVVAIIQVTRPDLVATAIAVSPPMARPGGTLQAIDTVQLSRAAAGRGIDDGTTWSTDTQKD